MAYRVVILGSGRGSNARALLEAQKAGRLGRAEVAGILSDNSDAGILEHGRAFGVPAQFLSAAPFKTKLDGEAEQEYISHIRSWEPDLVVLAGFMRVLKKPFLQAFAGKIINLHPSLLPKYPGLHSIRRALEAGEVETGCTVHWVNEEVDGGRVIGQRQVPIKAEDSAGDLESRVHAAEHALLPEVIAKLSQSQA